MSSPHILFISQVYVPDPAAVGQHMADAAVAMVDRGRTVGVLTSAGGYDDPSQRFPLREVLNGVEVRRLPFSSFGKRTILARLLGQASFFLQTVFRGLFQRKLAAIVVTTSPPLGGVVGCLIGAIRRVPVIYWVMDLNPDQAVAAGIVRNDSFPVRAFDLLNRWILGRAKCVIALDRFMAERLLGKDPAAVAKVVILPPWPAAAEPQEISNGKNPFRTRHGMDGKRVIMYSGNHSLVHPLTTLLEAIEHFLDDDRLMFAFIGGGKGKAEVEEFVQRTAAKNVVVLPYQPLSSLPESLSAGDVQVVSMGNEMVGCVHPCKVYGAFALGRPILALAPQESYLTEFMERDKVGWRVNHGDVDGLVELLTLLRDLPERDLAEKGRRAKRLAQTQLSRERLLDKWCEHVEKAMGRSADESGVPTGAGVGLKGDRGGENR
jgi:colanic acid biosynthesis glycosyl transferase WcaI